MPIRIDGPASASGRTPAAGFEPPPLPDPVVGEPITRRLREEADVSETPPAAYGVRPPAQMPRWIPVAAGVSLLLLIQMWAC